MTERSDPFAEIEELFEQFSRLGSPLGEGIPVDIVDTEAELRVHADLPGREPGSIDIRLEDSRELHIEAEAPDVTVDGRYVTRERTAEATRRTVTLPAAVDGEKPEATYDNGVLTVTLPKLSGSDEGTDIPVN